MQEPKQILLQWIGPQDLNNEINESDADESTPLRRSQNQESTPQPSSPLRILVTENAFDHVVLLNPYSDQLNTRLLTQLRSSAEIVSVALADDGDFPTILQFADGQLDRAKQQHGPHARLALNLSSGSSEMIAVWIYLSQTKYPATLYRIMDGRCQRVELPAQGADWNAGPNRIQGHAEGAHPLGNGFDVEQHLGKLRGHYLRRAMEEAKGVKARAARLLGIKHYQTLSAQLDRLNLTGPWCPPSGDGSTAKS